MTHDELLANIKTNLASYVNKGYGRKKNLELWINIIGSLEALRAVLELHKPEKWDGDFDRCAGCYVESTLTRVSTSYPCPTIEAIEKELQ